MTVSGGSRLTRPTPPFVWDLIDRAFDHIRHRAKIGLHEMMHSWKRMGDVAYGGESGFPRNASAIQGNTAFFGNLIRESEE